jgi:SSS family solute:Na+ symporter
LMSAAMSTMSSDLNCLSAVGVEDYYRKLRPNSSDKQRLFVGKIIVAVCGIIAVGVGFFIAQKGDSALKLYYAATAIVSAGLAGMFLLAFLSRRANRQGLWIGIVCALIFTAWAVLTTTKGAEGKLLLDLKKFNYTWPSVMLGVIAHVIVLVVGWLTSFLFPPEANMKSEWTFWGWIAKRKIRGEENAVAPGATMEAQS